MAASWLVARLPDGEVTGYLTYTYDCHRILKHVSKSYNIFCDVHDSHKRVVGLIYTKQFVL